MTEYAESNKWVLFRSRKMLISCFKLERRPIITPFVIESRKRSDSKRRFLVPKKHSPPLLRVFESHRKQFIRVSDNGS